MKKVLIVDDSKIQVKFVERVCSKVGIPFESCYDGVEAVEVVRSRGGDFSLVITDLVMTVMNGLEATREILKFRPDMTVYGMSSNTESDDPTPTQLIGAGAVECLKKPVHPRDIERVLRTSFSC